MGKLHEYRMEQINSPQQAPQAMSPPMSPLAAAAAPHMHPSIEPMYQHWSDGTRTVLAPMAHGPPLELPGFMSPEQVAAEVAYSEHLQQQQWQAGPQMEDLALVPPPVALTSPTSKLLHDIRQKSEASTQESLKALQKEKDALMQESEQLRKIWNDVSNS